MSIRHFIYKKYFESEWAIAWRKSSKIGDLFGDENAPFVEIQNTDKYWFADPLAFANNDEDYLFAEGYDRNKGKGVIGFFKYENGSFSDFQCVLERPYHLSFPFVFRYMHDIYMIPETKGNKTLEIYKAEEFPYKWAGPYILQDNILSTDSIVFEMENELVLITHKEQDKINVEIYNLDIENLSILKIGSLDDVKNNARGAGGIIRIDNALYRPCQNGQKRYGGSLILKRIESVHPYSESIVKEVFPENINLISKRGIKGIHSYSTMNDIEIVDILYSKPTDWILSLYKKLRRPAN